jgi:decaprenyl-phosphate phosphoribosyltransferase
MKNVLVFAAPGAAGQLTDVHSLVMCSVLFVAFCLVSSGTYFWNDIFDVELDRLHPVKRFRPIASGVVTVGRGRIVGTLLITVGLGAAAIPNWRCSIAAAIYVALTLSYSAIWKRLAVVDIVVVASGFVIRAIVGALAIEVPPSAWFLLFVSFGSLFVVTGKRYAELRDLGVEATRARASLDVYSLGYLRLVLGTTLAVALLAYCRWAFDASTADHHHGTTYVLTVVPMCAALLRYALVLEQGHGAAPEEVFIADRPLQVLGALWLVAVAGAIYL